MARETNKEKRTAAIEAKVAELIDIWSTDSGSPFDETQVLEAVARFKLLIPGYLEKDMSLELALTAAALAASAIVDHPRKMSQTCEELGLHSHDHNVESLLFRIGERFRVDVCAAMMCFLAQQMGITREITPGDFSAIIEGKPLTYEEFPILAFNYFRQEVDLAIAAKTPLLN
ncbi:hypothetical protein A3A84_04220 [Candidatus Collierbacteria bacterium RIFCSPLOWO2_01_FULL_50_23]|uniref:Uncharacterized protein n=2 Tax=Candidatus Collieribacteriota TaxID=1752725 RepID=A0A1F5EUS5_9BACT|nr:MAG: hypothetical protein A3D09_02005 [Candidatus Collierbacteria bacterium RIFCSPHIGHO2_02_FULL_49_10]OGD71672.1 MAG: hypothetical protein A2703_01725 [Candidatus Collierbacteria bacterium RIFCSPHIGHO2_01_FULL_50_25]OGD73984.1 MAG: hypothetical protein A3A84_04220 [Candidatus Collierbacteria bacterium RIFCSPLOWO2_01_FULL_50_23]